MVLFHDLLHVKHPAIAIGIPCVWMTARHAHYYRIIKRLLLTQRAMTNKEKESTTEEEMREAAAFMFIPDALIARLR